MMKKNERAKIEDETRSKTKKSIPHLKVIDGKVHIDPDFPLQRKWFDEFKK